SEMERRRLFDTVLRRFLVWHDKWRWLRMPARGLAQSTSPILNPLRALLARLKRRERRASLASGEKMLYEPEAKAKRTALGQAIFGRVKGEGRLDPETCLQSSWEQIEADALNRFA